MLQETQWVFSDGNCEENRKKLTELFCSSAYLDPDAKK